MWPFKRPKTIQGLHGSDLIELSNREPVSLDGIMDTFEQVGKDIGEVITAINRIERKQNRWLELLNLKEESSPLPIAGVGRLKQPGLGEVAITGDNSGSEIPALAGEPTED